MVVIRAVIFIRRSWTGTGSRESKSLAFLKLIFYVRIVLCLFLVPIGISLKVCSWGGKAG